MPSPRLPNEPFSSMQATLPMTTASMPQTICGKNIKTINIIVLIICYIEPQNIIRLSSISDTFVEYLGRYKSVHSAH